ncbi:hypothetical protein TKK_0013669 [Trichogramma kaykai]
MATKTLSPPSLPRSDDDVDPSPNAVLLREFESLREEMRSRMEALLAGQRTRAAAELRNASSSADLLALSGVSREPVRSEIVFRPFWRSAPGVWFATLEEKFAARGIIDENEMYLNTIGNLDEDIIRDISVAVGALPVRERYTRLKQILLNKFSLSDSDKLRSLFGAVSMGSRSPSEYMEFLIANGAKSLDKDINPGNEESMIKKADEIYASLRRDEHCNTSYGLNAIDSRRTREENSRIEILERKLDQVLDSIEQRKRDRGTSYNNRNNNGNRGKWRSSRSDRDSNGGSGFCRLHSKYGKDAHRCSSTPCAWKEPNDDANGKKLETLAPDNSVRLHIRDRESGRVYMIDSGAEISVIPRPIDWKASSVNFGVKAANQLPIRVFGTENLIVNLDEDFIFPWTFVVADVPYPIIGGDILSRFHLLPDLTCKCLLDAANNRVGDCYISQYADDEPLVAGISLDLGSGPFAHIFKRYPDVIGLIPPKPIIDSEVFHYIETDGLQMEPYQALYEAIRGQRELARDPSWADDLRNTEICLDEFREAVQAVVEARLRRVNRKRRSDGIGIVATSIDFRVPSLFHNGAPIKRFKLSGISGSMRRQQIERMLDDANIRPCVVSCVRPSARATTAKITCERLATACRLQLLVFLKRIVWTRYTNVLHDTENAIAVRPIIGSLSEIAASRSDAGTIDGVKDESPVNRLLRDLDSLEHFCRFLPIDDLVNFWMYSRRQALVPFIMKRRVDSAWPGFVGQNAAQQIQSYISRYSPREIVLGERGVVADVSVARRVLGSPSVELPVRVQLLDLSGIKIDSNIIETVRSSYNINKFVVADSSIVLSQAFSRIQMRQLFVSNNNHLQGRFLAHARDTLQLLSLSSCRDVNIFTVIEYASSNLILKELHLSDCHWLANGQTDALILLLEALINENAYCEVLSISFRDVVESNGPFDRRAINVDHPWPLGEF